MELKTSSFHKMCATPYYCDQEAGDWGQCEASTSKSPTFPPRLAKEDLEFGAACQKKLWKNCASPDVRLSPSRIEVRKKPPFQVKIEWRKVTCTPCSHVSGRRTRHDPKWRDKNIYIQCTTKRILNLEQHVRGSCERIALVLMWDFSPSRIEVRKKPTFQVKIEWRKSNTYAM